MGSALSGGTPVVKSQVGKPVSILPLSSEYPQGHLHHKCYRIGTSPVQETDQNQRGLPNENSLLKLLYLGLMNAQEKWVMLIQSWNLTLSQLAIYFEGRLNTVMAL
nr:hypothetical protein [Escherichia albertii]